MNHGHNLYQLTDKTVIEKDFAVGIEEILSVHTKAGVICIKQNPWRDSDTANIMHEAVEEYSTRRGFAIADVYSSFLKSNKNSTLYLDNIHPSQGNGNTGTQIFIDRVMEQLIKVPNTNSKIVESTLSLYRKNLLPNGEFGTWTNGSNPPDGWTVSGGTCSQDTALFEDPITARSCKLTATGGFSCYIKYVVPPALLAYLKGKTITVAAKTRVNSAGANSSSGRLNIISTSKNLTSSAIVATEKDEFTWSAVSLYVSPSDTSLEIRVYRTMSTDTVGNFINIDRVVLGVGLDIHDCI